MCPGVGVPGVRQLSPACAQAGGQASPAGPGGEGPQLGPLWNLSPTCSSHHTVGVSGSGQVQAAPYLSVCKVPAACPSGVGSSWDPVHPGRLGAWGLSTPGPWMLQAPHL